MKKEKRVVIAGCRYFNDYDVAKEYLDFCFRNLRQMYEIVIISGASKGADALGERYATENGFKIMQFPAEWERYGKRAGPIRNDLMASLADCVICFWDGKSRGTRSMISYAFKYEKPVQIKMIEK